MVRKGRKGRGYERRKEIMEKGHYGNMERNGRCKVREYGNMRSYSRSFQKLFQAFLGYSRLFQLFPGFCMFNRPECEKGGVKGGPQNCWPPF